MTQQINGSEVLITGNTFPVREQLRALGGRWDAREKGWYVTADKADQALALLLDPKDKQKQVPGSARLGSVNALGAPLSKPGTQYFIVNDAPVIDYGQVVIADIAKTSEVKRGVGHVDQIGAARSIDDKKAAEADGFSPADSLYTRGTRVLNLGVENARSSRLEHDEKPTVVDYCNDFCAVIAGEKRVDRDVPIRDLSMLPNGQLKRGANALPLAEPAFMGLMARIGKRGARYLADASSVRRAENFNLDVAEYAAEEDARIAEGHAARNVQLRLRKKAGNGPEIYAAVGPKYAPFDCNIIAEALGRAAPKDARGSVAYDGRKARFEVLFHSNVQAEKYVAGEFFKAGVLVRTDDTGGGAVSVSSVIWQNLCLNLIIIDKSIQNIASLRHVGSVDALAAKFSASFGKALSSIDHFRRAWGYAINDDVMVATKRDYRDEAGSADAELIMEGLFNGLVENEVVPLPRAKGQRVAIVSDLMNMWRKDTSAAAGPTRAAVVNAVTRYAHEVNQDPWRADALQSAAGSLLFGRGAAPPKALVYVPLELVMSDGSMHRASVDEAREFGVDDGQIGSSIIDDMLDC